MDKLSTLSRELYTTAAKLHPSAKKLYTSGGIIYTSAEKFYVSVGKLHTSTEKLYVSAGKLHISAEKLYISACKLHTSAEKLYTWARGLYTSVIIKRASNNVFFISPLKYYFVLSHKKNIMVFNLYDPFLIFKKRERGRRTITLSKKWQGFKIR